MFYSYYFLVYYIDRGEIQFHYTTLYGWATLLLSFLLLRLFDELKDMDIDRTLFPDRPLVKGSVTYKDVKILTLIVLFIVLLLNLNKGIVTSVYFIYFLLLILSWQWWWLFPEKVSGSFFLTTITHQPLVPLSFVYVYAVYSSLQESQSVHWFHAILLALLFSLPFLAWEIARKIRSREEETDYLTYSKRWGASRAALLPLIYLTLTTTGLLILIVMYQLSLVFLLFIIIVQSICGFFMIRFILSPVKKRNKMKSLVEFYSLAFQAGLIAELLWQHFG
jgi:hypothetical protein